MTLGNNNGTDGQTDGQTDRVRRNMRPPPREEGRIISSLKRPINITRMHGGALRCVRSHSHSIWNMANLTPL